VTGSQGGLRDIDAHSPAGAGYEPDLLLTHAGCTSLVSILSISLWGCTASAVVHWLQNHV
jgi:hypothetical protein